MYRNFKQHEKFKATPGIALSTSVIELMPRLQNFNYAPSRKFLLRIEGYSFYLPELKTLLNEAVQYILKKLPKNHKGETTNVIEDWMLYLPLRNQYCP